MKCYHISDLHVTCDANHNRSIIDKLDQLNELMSDTDYLLVTGDITDNGSAEEYDAAKEILSLWNGRLLLVPGNHDYGWKGLAYSYDSYRSWVDMITWLDAYAPPMRAYPTIGTTRFCLWDSNIHTSGVFPLDFARGRIRTQDLTKLERLSQTSDQLIVALHHHPFPEPGRWEDLTLRLENAAEVRRATYGVASRVCFGHRHHGPRQWHLVDSTSTPGERFGRDLRNTVYQFSPSLDNTQVEEVVAWEL